MSNFKVVLESLIGISYGVILHAKIWNNTQAETRLVFFITVKKKTTKKI